MKIVLAFTIPVLVLLAISGHGHGQSQKEYLGHAFDMKCGVCQLAMNGVKDAVQAGETDVRKVLTQECDKLEIGADLCKAKLVQYSDDIAAKISTSSSASLCHRIRWCAANRDYFNVAPASVADDLPTKSSKAILIDLKCSSCMGLFTFLYNRLGTKLNSTELAAKLQNVCANAPTLLQGVCNQIIASNISRITSVFDQQNPKSMCTSLQLCSSSLKRVLEVDEDADYDSDELDAELDAADFDLALPDDDEEEVDIDVEVSDSDEDEDVDSDSDEDDDEDEEEDFDIAFEVDEEIEDQDEDSDFGIEDVDFEEEDIDTEFVVEDEDAADIEDELDQLDLDSLDESDDVEAEDEDSVEAVLKRGIAEDDDEDVGSEDDADDDDELDENSDAERDEDDSDVEETDDEDEDEKEDLPFGVEEDDDEDDDDEEVEVHDNGFALLKRMTDPANEDPRVFYFGLEGRKDKKAVLMPQIALAGADAQCQICQWAVSAIEAYISQPDTEQQFARVLQELCTVLPGNYASICQNFVVVYMDEAVNYVIDNLTPPVVCNKIDICLPSPAQAPTPTA